MRRLARAIGAIGAIGLCAALSAPAAAQDRTLADIRQELSVLFVEIQKLKRELSTTGGPTVAVGGDTLQRLDLIERELQRLTAHTEDLEFRIERIVADGTNRIGDLEFRLCELDPACDIANLPETPRLGGAGETPAATVTGTGTGTGTDTGTGGGDTAELAVGERADFDRARAALEAGDHAGAAAQFQTFVETYPGGPLTAEAHFLRGKALEAQGQTAASARAYLEAFSSAPKGPRAGEALLALGRSLAKLGQRDEACVMLGEVGARFPGSAPAAEAERELNALGCL